MTKRMMLAIPTFISDANTAGLKVDQDDLENVHQRWRSYRYK